MRQRRVSGGMRRTQRSRGRPQGASAQAAPFGHLRQWCLSGGMRRTQRSCGRPQALLVGPDGSRASPRQPKTRFRLDGAKIAKFASYAESVGRVGVTRGLLGGERRAYRFSAWPASTVYLRWNFIGRAEQDFGPVYMKALFDCRGQKAFRGYPLREAPAVLEQAQGRRASAP